jgi:hypothetical protein
MKSKACQHATSGWEYSKIPLLSALSTALPGRAGAVSAHHHISVVPTVTLERWKAPPRGYHRRPSRIWPTIAT